MGETPSNSLASLLARPRFAELLHWTSAEKERLAGATWARVRQQGITLLELRVKLNLRPLDHRCLPLLHHSGAPWRKSLGAPFFILAALPLLPRLARSAWWTWLGVSELTHRAQRA